MSTQKIALGIILRMNKSNIASANGKYYPDMDVQKTKKMPHQNPLKKEGSFST